MVDSYVWETVLPRDMTSKHSQCSHTPTPIPSPTLGIWKYVRPFLLLVPVWLGVVLTQGGRKARMHGDSPKTLIKPPLRNAILGSMQIQEQS